MSRTRKLSPKSDYPRGYAYTPEKVLQRYAEREARFLAQLIGKNGETAYSLRGDICIDGEAAEALREFVKREPKEAYWVRQAIRFRSLVLKEFDALAQSRPYRERAQKAEAEAARIPNSEIPVLPLFHELVRPMQSGKIFLLESNQ